MSVRKITPIGTNWVVTTIAGLAGHSGAADGTNENARFGSPSGGVTGIAVDGAINLYVSDFGNNTIRKITPSGTNWVVTTIAGLPGQFGATDGLGPVARFKGLGALALDASTNLYVPDINNFTIRKLSPSGTNWLVTTLAGKALVGGGVDGIGVAARFSGPNGIAVDPAGTVYIVDNAGDTIRKGVPPLLIESNAASFNTSAGQFGFTLVGPGGQTVVVDASSDLANWSPIWTNTLTFPAPVSFTDPQPASNSARFYRARTP